MKLAFKRRLTHERIRSCMNENTHYILNANAMTNTIKSVHEFVLRKPEDKRIMSLDLEWGDGFFRSGRQQRTAVLQLSYRRNADDDSHKGIRALVIKTARERGKRNCRC